MTLKEIFKDDRFAACAGCELVDISDGYAKATMKVTEHHLNAGNVCQGGALFTLADLAFAAAVNTYKTLSLSISSDIHFFKSAYEGELLTAEAIVKSNHPKVPYCEVIITNENGEVLARFGGQSYRKNVPLEFEKFI